jgi:ribosomal protein S18 acetylase RimI-like enzyme
MLLHRCLFSLVKRGKGIGKMEIRHIRVDDAEKFMQLVRRVENEAKYMLLEPGERNTSIDKQMKLIENILKENHSTIFVAEESAELVGYLIAIGNKAKRKRHSVYLVIGILQSYRGKGIGTRLFRKLEEWAKKHKLRRLELTVVTRNDAGIGLYQKMGFEIEGTKKDSLLLEGEFVDEYYMAKLI